MNDDRTVPGTVFLNNSSRRPAAQCREEKSEEEGTRIFNTQCNKNHLLFLFLFRCVILYVLFVLHLYSYSMILYCTQED